MVGADWTNARQHKASRGWHWAATPAGLRWYYRGQKGTRYFKPGILRVPVRGGHQYYVGLHRVRLAEYAGPFPTFDAAEGHYLMMYP